MPHHLVCVEKFTLPYLTVGKGLWRRVADADAPNAGKPATPEQLVRFRMARDWDKAARGVARHGAMEHPSAD